MLKARILRETIYKTGRVTLQEVDTQIVIDSRPVAATKSSLQAVFNPEYVKLRSACNDVGHDQEGSGWVIIKFYYLKIFIYETRPVRGSSYIPTPIKFYNPKCGLINIKNDDQECFKWCF